MSPGGLLTLCAALAGPAEKAPPLLPPGGSLEAELAAGGSRLYAIDLRAGEFVHVVVEQHGIDVAAALLGPDGTVLLESDTAERGAGLESLPLVARTGGLHRLRVSAAGRATGSGRYHVSLTAPRVLTAQDQVRVEAEQAFAEGERLRRQGGAEASRKAAEALACAQALFAGLEDRQRVAAALSRRAAAHVAVGEYDLGLERLGEAALAWRALGDVFHEGEVLDLAGEAHFYRGELLPALARLDEALTRRRAAGDRVGEARTLENLAVVHARAGDVDRAVGLRREALDLWRGLRLPGEEAATLGNLAVSLAENGDLQGAIDQLQEVLPIRRAAGDRAGEAATLTNLAVVYQRLGDRPRALEQHQRALALWRELGDRRGEGTVLNGIGQIHAQEDRLPQAVEVLGQALAVRREIGDRRGEATTLVNLATAYARQGQTAKAEEHFQQGLERVRQVGDLRGEMGALAAYAHFQSDNGAAESALAMGVEALALAGRLQSRPGEAMAHYERARAQRAAGRLEEARGEVARALEILESLRGQVRDADLRAAFSSSLREVYELHVDVLMRLHERDPGARRDAEALAVAERARARSLLELLLESRHAVREGVDPVLREREVQALRRLQSRLERRVRLLAGPHTPDQVETLTREIEALRVEREQTQREIRARSPRYAELTQPEPASLAAIQGALDAGTRLLEVLLAEPRSYLWVVGPAGIRGHALPGRAEIEDLARTLYDEWSRRPERSAAAQGAAAALGRLLLGPLESEPPDSRLVVVSDGALQYLPLGALPDPRTGRPLILDREVVGAPSASTLVLLRAPAPDRKPAPRLVAVLADPVFDGGDARVRRGGGNGPAADPGGDGEPRGGAEDIGFTARLARLPFTRREARAIAALAPPGSAWVALDFAANRAAATSPRLGEYRFVHFATHGFLDGAHPERSGLVLSLVDEKGAPRDGFLTAAEVFNLKLAAELVVLSACRSGLGRDVKGEGLVGLTRGFMYAGAPRVVASLWRVDDAATSTLMTAFYRALLGSAGRTPAAALRAAQVALARDPRWAAPYYWAAFQLQGVWH
jgi:CHAT domain-containing protein/tetratricopeptide (TPR) repeat protein